MLKDKVQIQRRQSGSTYTANVRLSKEGGGAELSSQYAAEKEWTILVHCSLLLAQNLRELCLLLLSIRKKNCLLCGVQVQADQPQLLDPVLRTDIP